MRNKIWIPVIALLLLSSLDSYSQRWRLRRYEADLYVGAVLFHGDIGLANKDFLNNFNGMRPSVGFKPSFRIAKDFAVSLDLAWLMYGGKDEEGSTHSRVYSFNSQAFQHVARVEYYVIGDSRTFVSGAVYNRRGMINNYNKLYQYFFAGVGGILSKATVKDLNNGGEEPLENPGYNNNTNYAAVFPLGAGLKWSIDPRWSIGAELGYQFVLSDYLDGYASEFSEYNDSYFLASVKAIYKIRNNRNGRPIFKRLYR
ncbi:MAG: hypothetical protein ABFS28_14595 [Bacteroidota bacterium]